jgi:hypothetical protein
MLDKGEKTMTLPGFGAESALGKLSRSYSEKYLYGGDFSWSQNGLPATLFPSQQWESGQAEDMEALDSDADELDDEGYEIDLADADESDELESQEMEA